jgi:hypothetical protein
MASMASRDDGVRAWLSLQQASFEALAGQTVTHWEGVEMALRESTPTGPQFADVAMPFLQLVRLDLKVGAHPGCTIDTYQDDSEFGLQLTPPQPLEPRDWDGIYRHRALDLPFGTIGSVDVRVEEGTLAEVTLRFSDAEMLLIAGEASEEWDGTLSLHRYDESVLVFTDLAAARALTWIPPRTV